MVRGVYIKLLSEPILLGAKKAKRHFDNLMLQCSLQNTIRELYIMKRKIVTALAVLTALSVLTGCESTKKEVMAKRYNLVIHNVSSTACSFLVIGEIQKEYGYDDVLYHEDVAGVTCEDYDKTKGEFCKIKDAKEELGEDHAGVGSSSCVLGTDKKPTKDDAALATHFFDEADLQAEKTANR
jgi:hypothetical protein